MGDQFELLAPELQLFHGRLGYYKFSGSCVIEGPTKLLARGLHRLLGLPRTSTERPLSFDLQLSRAWEKWERHFPTGVMTSVLEFDGAHIVERLGPARLIFTPVRDGQSLSLKLERFTVLGIPCPSFLFPRVKADERGEDGRVHFDIAVDAPLIGKLVAYRGHLDVTSKGKG